MVSPQNLAVLILPVVTGLNGLIWAKVVDISGGPWLAIASNILALVIVAVVLSAVGWVSPTSTGRTWTLFLALTALNTITTALWLYPIVSGTRYVSLALIEGAWPIFSILFGWLLFGALEVDAMSSVGGALIIAGAALVFHRY